MREAAEITVRSFKFAGRPGAKWCYKIRVELLWKFTDGWHCYAAQLSLLLEDLV